LAAPVCHLLDVAPYPGPIFDNRETEIQVGCRVAYNLSGEIGVGTVKEIAQATRYGHIHPLIKIIPEFPKSVASRQSESKVRDAKCVLVIEAAPGQGEPSALESLLGNDLKS
jgi:hypothetical protein